MPPFKDDDTRVLTGFDLQTASTLYWKAIPVLLKQLDREDQTEQLTFRILSGVTRQNHNLRVRRRPRRGRRRGAPWRAPPRRTARPGARCSRARPPARRARARVTAPRPAPALRRPPRQVLRIHVSSDDDPFFLHTLEVSEEDFQGLKADQGILVDFGNFPGKIISLLERCLASQTSDMPRFQVPGRAGARPGARGVAAAAGAVRARGGPFARRRARARHTAPAHPACFPVPAAPAGGAERQGLRQRVQGGRDQRLQATAPHHARVPARQRHRRQAGA
jgi:hypothetical protein